ncbi:MULTISPECIES: hypothetical protein [unclassified Pseudoalteromonas]|uniref:hypothetical protein n=1 Tax=unclassified Pseudoalteromonas TaxID=194690 RepID=UPI002359A304|nr:MULTISPECIES: hypothetical protein [unclassified Pseudoalteromonas]MCP4058850.1 hypothetical protein [Pseudoalteromonas sp.]MDC9563469.1 hypothetical protein [Pseudoalteromonas sp. GAB2316C]MDC9572049.1 hypothetical protein [Pseudoalteromonas sp. GABNS16A]MDC9583916.1 hypothetical protein [Pseudoalteromonas sp. GABNS16C]MDC9607815.1 hypothetical protein [Pseudoalteromonas sp. GABNS16H]|tara:strand:+ start:42618 stop:43022 length:405 start_codon:yes stop_codon:yes gene_type:complete
MSSIIKVTARIKRESKLGVHLVNDSQLSGYPNELIRLAIQGLLYEQLLTKNTILNLAFNDNNQNADVANANTHVSNTNKSFDIENKNAADSANDHQSSSENEQATDNEIDLLGYLDKYVQDSNLNLEDLNYNNS